MALLVWETGWVGTPDDHCFGSLLSKQGRPVSRGTSSDYSLSENPLKGANLCFSLGMWAFCRCDSPLGKLPKGKKSSFWLTVQRLQVAFWSGLRQRVLCGRGSGSPLGDQEVYDGKRRGQDHSFFFMGMFFEQSPSLGNADPNSSN